MRPGLAPRRGRGAEWRVRPAEWCGRPACQCQARTAPLSPTRTPRRSAHGEGSHGRTQAQVSIRLRRGKGGRSPGKTTGGPSARVLDHGTAHRRGPPRECAVGRPVPQDSAQRPDDRRRRCDRPGRPRPSTQPPFNLRASWRKKRGRSRRHGASAAKIAARGSPACATRLRRAITCPARFSRSLFLGKFGWYRACPAPVAQWIEHRTSNPMVAGSNPAGGTTP